MESIIDRDKSGKFLKGVKSNEKAQFKKGHTPWNKGISMSIETYNKVKRTMFASGHIPATMTHNGKPYLSTRKRKNGQLEKCWYIHVDKMRKRYLKYLCELNGIKLGGRIPRLKEGVDINTEPTIENIILITRQENMNLNSFQRFPEDLRRLVQIKGALSRQINKRI